MLGFRIQLENKEHIACSGSLLNRRSVISCSSLTNNGCHLLFVPITFTFSHLRNSFRWVISAAHCFCALNEHVECTLVNRGFDKKLEEKDKVFGKHFNEK